MKRILAGHSDAVGEWVYKQNKGTWFPGQGQAIGLLDGHKLIAGVVWDNWNGSSMQLHVASAADGWITRELLRETFRYPFEMCKVKKLVGLVGSQNEKALRLNAHLGFTVEATLLDAHPDGALVIMTMTRDQCRWLDRRNSGKELSTAG